MRGKIVAIVWQAEDGVIHISETGAEMPPRKKE